MSIPVSYSVHADAHPPQVRRDGGDAVRLLDPQLARIPDPQAVPRDSPEHGQHGNLVDHPRSRRAGNLPAFQDSSPANLERACPLPALPRFITDLDPRPHGPEHVQHCRSGRVQSDALDAQP